MEQVIDAKGKACPQPVLMTKKALESMTEGTLTVVVDSAISKDNVVRFATSQGCETRVEEREGVFYIEVAKGKQESHSGSDEISLKKGESKENVTIYVHSDTMGRGDDTLGAILIKGFLKTLKDVDPKPRRMIFVNRGIFLTTEGSEVIETLKELEAMGVEILSCGTCLDFFHRKDASNVGIASNMFDITSALMQADKVVIP